MTLLFFFHWCRNVRFLTIQWDCLSLGSRFWHERGHVYIAWRVTTNSLNHLSLSFTRCSTNQNQFLYYGSHLNAAVYHRKSEQTYTSHKNNSLLNYFLIPLSILIYFSWIKSFLDIRMSKLSPSLLLPSALGKTLRYFESLCFINYFNQGSVTATVDGKHLVNIDIYLIFKYLQYIETASIVRVIFFFYIYI